MLTRTSFVISILVTVLALIVPTGAQKRTAPVRVFLTSVGAANGFTDPNKDNQDTMKDLRDEVKGRKSLVLAESRDDAVIVLVVMNRETAQTTAGFLGSPARDRMVRVKFIYGDFETEMSGSAQGGTLGSGGAWGKAAGKVIKQVDEWVTTNRSKLPEDGRGRRQ
jgi:hypothetical protein